MFDIEKEDNIKETNINSTSDTKTLKSICDEIESAKQGKGGIDLDPDYQREYRFTIEDESLLIESILLGIPIPTIYLSSDTRKSPYVANVIDGQHRLRAVYRFIRNQFSLKGLEIYSELNGKKFDDLNVEVQNKLLYQSSFSFQNIHVQDNSTIEIEIFKRYNKGSHPLSKQELRNAIYICNYNIWLNGEIKSIFLSKDARLKEIYNISVKRFSDKSAHESICVMLCILKFGLMENLVTSPEYADYLLSYVCKDNSNQEELIKESKRYFDKINEFLLVLFDKKYIRNPFSKEIYGIQSINYKLQIPIVMLIAGFLYEIRFLTVEFNDDNVSILLGIIKKILANSYLETGFKGSNTRPNILKSTVDKMVEEYNKEMIKLKGSNG